jgi:3-hydroxyacyl-CoA dehydrogenase / 3-hydroxy-2-methylbutyryl-CoA dehydrogenase
VRTSGFGTHGTEEIFAMNVKDAVVMITGGGSGLGAASAREFAQAGGRIVVMDLPSSPGAEVAAQFGDKGIFTPADVTSESQVSEAIAAATARFKGIDVLINCAGIAIGERVVGKEGPHALASFVRTININLIGSFNMTRLAADLMSRNAPNAAGERGVIVYTASVAAYDGQIGQAAYSASKAGLVGMTLPIARELARHGIRVMTIAPGLFETPMMAGMSAEVQESLGKMVPFPPRLGRPPEYASLVGEIIRNEMLNGETIRLDGAIRLAPK